MVKLTNIIGGNGRDIDGIPVSDTINARNITIGGTAEDLTIPSGAKYVVFSATADFYVGWSATAAVPADVTDGSASELNPTVRRLTQSVLDAGVVSVNAPAAGTIITASFYN